MEDPEAAMSLLKTFVSGKGTKRPASEQEAIDNIRSFGKEISSDTIKEHILAFVKLRVLKDKDDNDRYELRHDALAEKIFEKFSTAEKELLEIRQMIENAYQYYLKRNILLNNADLNYISGKDSVLNLSPELISFMEDSRKLQQATRRSFKSLIFISFFAFILLLTTIVYTIVNRSKASLALDLSTISANQYMKPSDKLSIAGHAWKEKDSNPSKAALLKSFNYAIMNPGTDSGLLQLSGKYSRNFAPASSTIGFASCSEDYRYIFGYTEDTVFIWKTDGTIYSKFRCGDAPPATVRMSDNGVYIGCLGTDSLLKVWDVIGNLRFTRKICYQKLQADKSFRFTKDDNVFTLTPDHDAILLDLNGNLLQTFDHHKGNVNALDLSNDNIFLATASSDSTINIWYLNSETKKYEFYNTLNKHKNGVRSVDFAPNNRYLVSVSIDNSVKVTSINNLVVSTFRDDLRLYYSVPVGYPLSAEFDRTGTAVVITSYPDSVIRRERMIGIYFDSYIHNTTIGENSLFDFVTFSPDKKYFAYKSGEDISLASRTTFNIYSPNNYRLFQIEGDKPFFSPDGKYLYSVCGNQIKCWFIDIDIISLIALQWYRNWHMQS